MAAWGRDHTHRPHMTHSRLAARSFLPHISWMTRTDLTWRVVPAGSAEASDAHLGTTCVERSAMVTELSRLAWIASGRPFPRYERAKIPVRFATLREQGSSDDW